MKGLLYRIFLTCVNIFFPPMAVMMLCGANLDCVLNCAFFILAVIPSHIHGFYLTCTYFHRRSKVKKGRYPGGSRSMVFSNYILNGGASNAEVERLYRKEKGGSSWRSSRANSRNRDAKQNEMVSRRESNKLRLTPTNASRISDPVRMRPLPEPPVQAEYIARDGYGLSSQRPVPATSASSNVSGGRWKW